MKHGKKYIESLNKFDRAIEYLPEEALELVKANSKAKFDETVEATVNLGVDPKRADQNIRVTTSLPHGTGRVVSVLVLTDSSSLNDAIDAGADFAGSDEYIKKLESGWDEIDVIVASPEMMPKLGKLGKILGPKGLMPNPKSGTVTKDVIKAVKEIKAGRVELRVDKYGIIHVAIGKSSLEVDHLTDNLRTVISVLMREKPTSVKGAYLKKITVSSTMGPGVKVDKSPLI
ncbi:MAG: 50S ribosomal protein L1 [Candidatus Marinimicrobia bacterium]|jgi:large subunit ribosomal protein L1|nr:50S ribosomal protein L1 [Candidatus Neomarinimicrobiota bacterium]|tara:strand:- start:12104 stop:12793 length:690 start_codon:yes stop_codon:yes gene_type:complete